MLESVRESKCKGGVDLEQETSVGMGIETFETRLFEMKVEPMAKSSPRVSLTNSLQTAKACSRPLKREARNRPDK
jgi:hypothetical protein